jgi:hypothetical protein
MDVARHLDQLIHAALDRDPRTALVACRRLERDELPWLTERAVRLARAEGWSWRPIARLLHISHQAAQKRYRSVVGSAPRPAARQPEFGELEERAYIALMRNIRYEAELRAWEESGDGIVPW